MASERVWATPAAVLHLAATILAGVLSGGLLTAWLTEVSLDGSDELWIVYHQALTPAYTLALPTIGILALIAAGLTLATSWRTLPIRRLLFTATWCLLFGLAVTVAVHFPINAEVLSWQPAEPPADWNKVRVRWLIAHGIRAVFALAAFLLLVLAAFRRHRIVDETVSDEPSEVRGSK